MKAFKPGDNRTIYRDYQTQQIVEGQATLIEKVRDGLSFSDGDRLYTYERWVVEFEDGFRTQRNLRRIYKGKHANYRSNVGKYDHVDETSDEY